MEAAHSVPKLRKRTAKLWCVDPATREVVTSLRRHPSTYRLEATRCARRRPAGGGISHAMADAAVRTTALSLGAAGATALFEAVMIVNSLTT